MADKRNWSDSEAQSICEQLECVLASAAFVQAERLGRFLAFVVKQSLTGNARGPNQYAIAMEVFDRDETFDPNIDAIVRVEAGRLRSRLLEYYDEAGRDDPIRIGLAKRGYLANFQFRPAVETEPGFESTTIPVSPTIAVMPFINMSPDPEQEYFADGITEDLITDLSKLPGVSVISRQSTFSYKGAAVTVQQVCKELGANLVLEGSVRKVGDSVRITAQLIDGISGKHIWAQRYQRDLGDIFELQDEVNQKLVNALSLQLSDSERQRLGRRGTDVIDAYDYVLRGMKEARAFTLEGSARARYCFESALELDPVYASAYARLALNHIYRWIAGWSKSRTETVDKGTELATKAVALDDKLALAHAALCWAYLWQGDHEQAIAEGRLAIELDPNDVIALERLALSMNLAGDAASALPLIDRAKRLNRNQTYNFSRGLAMFVLQEYEEAISLLKSDFEENPNFIPSGLYLAASYSLAGHAGDAAATVANIHRVSPNYKIADSSRTQFKNPEDRERFASGLQQAGLS
jgi:adenylate cyclase